MKILHRSSDQIGVFRPCKGSYNILNPQWLKIIEEDCKTNEKKRSRINFHADDNDTLHEMIIAIHKTSKIPIHKHIGKSESFHVIKGKIAIVFFEEERMKITSDVILDEKINRYYRLDEALYHLVIPLSEVVIIHETTNGPFNRETTKEAPWSQTSEQQYGVELIVEKFQKSHASSE